MVKTTTWHEHLNAAAESVKLKWDEAKDWEGKDSPHLGVYIGNASRHWKERLKKARGAWECVRRLTRLPPIAKRTIVCGQLIPILCYGCEAFEQPNEEMRRLVRTWRRWVIGAWRGSSDLKVEALSGIDNPDKWFRKRKIRWAALVYGRHLPALRYIAEKILRQRYEGCNIQFNWIEQQVRMADRMPFAIQDLDGDRVQEYSDGSRLDEAAAAATTKRAKYLGTYATVMDAEMTGVLLAIEDGDSCVALDSQGAVQRLEQLYTQPARSWIEAQLQAKNKEGCTVMWVRGHAGVKGNEIADSNARIRAYGGRVMHQPNVLTPAGIRHNHRNHCKGAHLKWTRKQLRGLTFIITDRGPMQRWQWVIRRADDPFCQCGEIQNAIHLTRCRLVADGAGRSLEQVWEDREWCAAVVDFLS